jgi:hypothetical protein
MFHSFVQAKKGLLLVQIVQKLKSTPAVMDVPEKRPVVKRLARPHVFISTGREYRQGAYKHTELRVLAGIRKSQIWQNCQTYRRPLGIVDFHFPVPLIWLGPVVSYSEV